MSNNEVKFSKREEELCKKWDGVADHVPVDGAQYSFDSNARKQAFIEAQFPICRGRTTTAAVGNG